MLRLQRLALTDFRNYASLTWRPGARISVLYGPNGSGKTNLLEAVSLLVPGRGLRGARQADLARRGGGGGWAVAARLHTHLGEADVGTGTSPEASGAERRVFRLDGTVPRSQADIAARVAAVWLTPQMDRLFQEGPSGRRRFLDRLVWAVEPAHAREIAAHDTAVGSRNRLLAEGRADRAWLGGVEDAIARHAVAATAARSALVAQLNHTLEAGAASGFPISRLGLVCPIAERLAATPAVAVEDWLRAVLETSRPRDAAAGSTSFGVHRSDMTLTDVATGTEAALASTGQQKALLIGVVLGHAELITEARGFAPLLLLDEPAVHLDPERRAALFAILKGLSAQTLITGTDLDIFLPLAGDAEALQTRDGKLLADARFPVPESHAAPVTRTL